MGLIRSLFWFALFLAATFFFTVLFEHGPGDFAVNAGQELKLLQGLYDKNNAQKKDDLEKQGR